MENLSKYKELLDRANQLISELERGKLKAEQLSELEKCTGELHERSIILKYLAFERQVKGEEQEETKVEPEAEVEAPISKSVEADEVSFDLFEEDEQVEEDLSAKMKVEEETPVFEPFATETIEEELDEVEVVEPVEAEMKEDGSDEIEMKSEELVPSPVPAGSFMSNVKLAETGSLGSGPKLNSLVGAFGLNERLRFINNLFDGSSDLFAEAIKTLDSHDSMNSAGDAIEDLASKHEWDPEEETVVDFMQVVKRRYA